MTDFRVVASETLLDAGFLSVSRLHVAASDGEEFDRHVVHHPGAVVVVPVIGREALLVRQWRVATGRVLLEIPAGKRDVEGEAPETTANRELEERERAAVSHEEAAMTIERVPLDRIDDLIADRQLIDAKSIIGLLLARQFLAR